MTSKAAEEPNRSQPLALSAAARRFLKSLAHHLSPVVQIGKNRVSPEVLSEIERGLQDHELIKVRFAAEPGTEAEWQPLFGKKLGAAVVGLIGHVLILYRPNLERPRISLPDQPGTRRAAKPEAKSQGSRERTPRRTHTKPPHPRAKARSTETRRPRRKQS